MPNSKMVRMSPGFADKDCVRCGSTYFGHGKGQYCSIACNYAANVDKRGDDECWGWRGKTVTGYGMLYIGGKSVLAHRYSLALDKGQAASEDLFALHRCDNPPCTNPNHLFWGTQADNMADCAAKVRTRKRYGRCARGHEYTAENTSIRGDGARICLACKRISYHSRKANNACRPALVVSANGQLVERASGNGEARRG